jgi:formylglycine-generating enzyme required for sulfatase activity
MSERLFVSYSSKDKDAVLRLAEDLKRAGAEVWLDQYQIQVGDRITQKIQEGLKDARYLTVWLTREAVQSGWVEREWQSKFSAEIHSGQKVILPLLVEDCEMPPLLVDRKYADFRTDYGEGLSELLQVVGKQDWENSFGMKFRLIPPGAFLMGSKGGGENEAPVHQIPINRPFYMGTYVVTQHQWKSVMDTEPWKGERMVREGDKYPAVNVNWFDAQQLVTRLSGIDGHSYSLPKEEEWEYAARAGTTTAFSFGDDERDMLAYGWCQEMTQNVEEYAHEVGLKKPNPWGLYDVHGNIWEWTDDWYYGSYEAKPLNPVEKVLRGGAWDWPADGARSAFRNHLLPTRTNYTIGIRLVLSRIMT